MSEYIKMQLNFKDFQCLKIKIYNESTGESSNFLSITLKDFQKIKDILNNSDKYKDF